MKKGSSSIQAIILQLLQKKRAVAHEQLQEDVEYILETKETKKRKVKPRYVINRTVKQLLLDNLIEEYPGAQSSFFGITKEGRHRLRNIKLSSQSHLVSTHWDGFWRIVIIDIPESRKKDQDALRYILKKAQFVQIKSSVWISPYPLEHMMINMKKDLKLHEEIMIFVTDKLDEDTQEILKRKFMDKQKDE